jgi:hypothetical protein
MFVPENEIVTLGPLGSYAADGTAGTADWHRFSAAGELLGRATDETQWWFELYFPEFRQVWDDLGGTSAVLFNDIVATLRLTD